MALVTQSITEVAGLSAFLWQGMAFIWTAAADCLLSMSSKQTCVRDKPCHGRQAVNMLHSRTPNANTSAAFVSLPSISSSGGICVTVPKVCKCYPRLSKAPSSKSATGPLSWAAKMPVTRASDSGPTFVSTLDMASNALLRPKSDTCNMQVTTKSLPCAPCRSEWRDAIGVACMQKAGDLSAAHKGLT